MYENQIQELFVPSADRQTPILSNLMVKFNLNARRNRAKYYEILQIGCRNVWNLIFRTDIQAEI